MAKSKNGTFLFDRGYMDYHADRFTDCSLMAYDGRGRLFALLPANRVGTTVYSHQGLTYGGLVIGDRATAADVCMLMEVVISHLHRLGATAVVYKPVPAVYCRVPSDEPLYALTEVCHAQLLKRDIASVVSLRQQLPLAELRRRGARKAERHGVSVGFSDDFATFWHILQDNLQSKYGARPVHTLDEMLLLNEHFPVNIRLAAAFHQGEMVAGTVLYVTPRVVKTQYISASPKGKELGALDLLFSQLINTLADSHCYLDMGTSALEHSTALRLPLIFQKEGFGARAVCCDTYRFEV